MRAIATAIRDRFHRWWGQYQAWLARLDEAMRAIATAIRDRFQNRRGQHQAWLARLDEAMRVIATAIRDRFQRWWGQRQARQAWHREQARQPACYSLSSAQRATAVAKWLLGLSGAGTVLAFAFYIQSYLSILSIKNDCVSLRFVADANRGAVFFVRSFLVSGVLALLAIAWPTAVGIVRNFFREAHTLPPLQSGHEFDGWSESRVRGWVTSVQWLMVTFSFVLFFVLTLYLAFFFAIGTTPERVLEEWHFFELQCLPHSSDQGGVS
jgi:hypothetical protein